MTLNENNIETARSLLTMKIYIKNKLLDAISKQSAQLATDTTEIQVLARQIAEYNLDSKT